MMDKMPAWLKVLLALVIFAILYGGSQLLLHMDKASTAKFGID